MPDATRPTIGVFFGGRSPEHDISIITGQLVLSTLRKLGYPTMPVYVDKDGRWLTHAELGSLKTFTGGADLSNRGWDRLVLDLEASQGKLVLKRKGLRSETLAMDVVFPAFHGEHGEDGTFQGLLEMFNVPFVGCGVTASAVTMDKILTKQLFQSFNLPTTAYVFFDRKNWDEERTTCLDRIEKELTWPVFVKPPRLGSSIGIGRVQTRAALEQAIEVAFKYGDRVLVEQGIADVMDVTCAVMGNDKPEPSLLQEAIYDQGFFSYEDKYLKDGGAQTGQATRNIVIPARLDEAVSKQTREMAVAIFRAFDCRGIARVDFLYDRTAKKMYANEINTMPGTLYHHLWKASGKDIAVVVQELIDLARADHAEKQKRVVTFASNLLQYANSIKLGLNDDQKKPSA